MWKDRSSPWITWPVDVPRRTIVSGRFFSEIATWIWHRTIGTSLCPLPSCPQTGYPSLHHSRWNYLTHFVGPVGSLKLSFFATHALFTVKSHEMNLCKTVGKIKQFLSQVKFCSKDVITIEDEQKALCTEDYSDISPLSGASVAFSTLEGRPSAFNFDHSPVLQVSSILL